MHGDTPNPAPQATPPADLFTARTLRVAYHLRRYVVLYVVGSLAAVAIAVFPTVESSQPLAAGGGAGANTGGVNFSTAGQAAPTDAGTSGADGSTATTVAATGGATAAGPVAATSQAAAATAAAGTAAAATHAAGAAGPAAATGAPAAAAAPGQVVVGAGTTVGGFACAPNVRQLPYSQYADPCEAHYTGDNGGATYNGVTAKAITISVRQYADANGANAAATDAEVEQAGGVSTATNWGYIQKIVAEGNKVFELYGRQVQLAQFNGTGQNSNEELGNGQAAACADADNAANTLHAFGDFNYSGVFESQPFSDCAARYHLYVPEGAAYFPETDYEQWSPYVWAITMQCELISTETAQFIGQQLFPYPAQWAGNDGVTNLQGAARKFATYIPNNAGYQDCANVANQQLQQRYHVPANRLDQYNYALDISQFPNDAQRAIVQFAANDDTDIVLACDPISPIFLTQDAANQNYHPEWVLNGVALTDSDSFAQLWSQPEITGHLFGLSQAGSTQAGLDPNGEAAKFLTAAGVPVNTSSVVDYFELISMFNQLQAAGPDLTPANIAAGTAKLPVAGGQTGPSGTWHFGSTHTAIIDSREIFYDAGATSPADGKAGTYVAVYGGRRFGDGQFPTGQPPFFS